MKNLIKKISIILCVTIVVIGTYSSNAYAGSLIMEKPEGKLIIKLPYNNQYFINLENMLPGQYFYKEMDIVNQSIYPYELFFKVSPRKGLSKKSLELLNYVNMKIVYGNKVIYNGCAHGEEIKNQNSGSLVKKISLGLFKPDETKKLKVFLSVSKKLDNSFANLESFTRWDFYSTRIYGGVDKVNINTPNGQLNTPSKILNSLIPYTGDNKNLYIYLLGVAICIIIMIFLNKKKQNKIKYEL